MSAYGPDYDGAMACCLFQWRALSCAMRRALRSPSSCRKQTAKALHTRGLFAHPARWSPPTPMGALALEAGLADIKRRTRPKV